MADKTEFEAELANFTAGNVHSVGDLSKGSFAQVPEGYRIEALESLQDAPNRVRERRCFRDTASLAKYLNRFQTPTSILFSAPTSQKITAVIDYHGSQDDPKHGDHSATFDAQWGSHYALWRKASGQTMSQVKAGLFLEERAIDVIEPDAASIMDMVMNFDALKKVTFKQSTRLHDGQRQFTYNEENEVRGNVTLPERIKLRIPVFDGQEPDVFLVRVRYRIEDGSLMFSFEIHDQDDLERTAFERCEDSLIAEMTTPLELLRVV